jgi:hypothetical protein
MMFSSFCIFSTLSSYDSSRLENTSVNLFASNSS